MLSNNRDLTHQQYGSILLARVQQVYICSYFLWRFNHALVYRKLALNHVSVHVLFVI